jgi:AAA domain
VVERKAGHATPALIKGVFPQTGVATIGGQSGSGKTFHALHLAARLVPDYQEHSYIDDYRINRKGGVVYLVLEGKPAFPMQVAAAFEDALGKQMQFGDKSKVPFAWNTFEPNLLARREVFERIHGLQHLDALETLSTIQNDSNTDPSIRVAVGFCSRSLLPPEDAIDTHSAIRRSSTRCS